MYAHVTVPENTANGNEEEVEKEVYERSPISIIKISNVWVYECLPAGFPRPVNGKLTIFCSPIIHRRW